MTPPCTVGSPLAPTQADAIDVFIYSPAGVGRRVRQRTAPGTRHRRPSGNRTAGSRYRWPARGDARRQQTPARGIPRARRLCLGTHVCLFGRDANGNGMISTASDSPGRERASPSVKSCKRCITEAWHDRRVIERCAADRRADGVPAGRPAANPINRVA